MKVIKTARRSPVLTPSRLACLANTPTINLTNGCAHSCLYCYARGYSTYPGEGTIVVYENTLDKLKAELMYRRTMPASVYFSPSSDLFQPVSEVLELGHYMLEFLLHKGIGVSFLTKGCIPDKTMKLLGNHADKVRAQIGIITPDDNVRRIFEPNAASVKKRLQQIWRMSATGIPVEARLMPIIPGFTDDPGQMKRLFDAIASAGVKRAAISTLFLRPVISSYLRCALDNRRFQALLSQYKNSARLTVHAEGSSVIPLPRGLREVIYERIGEIAGEFEIDVSVCGCMNPDIGGNCNIAGRWAPKYEQLSLLH